MIIVITIGNTDNKLTQQKWSDFITKIQSLINAFNCQVHFSGGSSVEKPWQNYTWIFEENDILVLGSLKKQLIDIRKTFSQDSVAWIEGKIKFI